MVWRPQILRCDVVDWAGDCLQRGEGCGTDLVVVIAGVEGNSSRSHHRYPADLQR